MARGWQGWQVVTKFRLSRFTRRIKLITVPRAENSEREKYGTALSFDYRARLGIWKTDGAITEEFKFQFIENAFGGEVGSSRFTTNERERKTVARLVRALDDESSCSIGQAVTRSSASDGGGARSLFRSRALARSLARNRREEAPWRSARGGACPGSAVYR